MRPDCHAAAEAGTIAALVRKLGALLAQEETKVDDFNLYFILWALFVISTGASAWATLRGKLSSGDLTSLAALLDDDERGASRSVAARLLARLTTVGEATSDAILQALPENFFPRKVQCEESNKLLALLVPAAKRKIELYASRQ